MEAAEETVPLKRTTVDPTPEGRTRANRIPRHSRRAFVSSSCGTVQPDGNGRFRAVVCRQARRFSTSGSVNFRRRPDTTIGQFSIDDRRAGRADNEDVPRAGRIRSEDGGNYGLYSSTASGSERAFSGQKKASGLVRPGAQERAEVSRAVRLVGHVRCKAGAGIDTRRGQATGAGFLSATSG